MKMWFSWKMWLVAGVGMAAAVGSCVETKDNPDYDPPGSGTGSGDSGSGGGSGSGSACGGCPTDTPVCDEESATCVACMGEQGCGGDTPACLAGDTPSENRCVACTAKAQEACGDGTCNVLENTCTEVAAASIGICEGCQGSAQCREGMQCVQTEAENKEAGYFCQHLRSAQGDNCGANAVPYFSTATRDTAEGGEAEVCALRVSTCPALLSFSNPCTKADAEGHAECGLEGFSDGYCVEVPDSEEVFVCSPVCNGEQDCPKQSNGTPTRCDAPDGTVDNFPSGAKVCSVN